MEMLFRCPECHSSLLDPRPYKKILLDEEKIGIKVCLLNVWIMHCTNCLNAGILYQAKEDDLTYPLEKEDIVKKTIACQLAGAPFLTGRQLSWLVRYLGILALKNETIAQWLGFDNFHLVEGETDAIHLSVLARNVRYLLAKKLGGENEEYFYQLTEEGRVSDKAIEVVKEGLSLLSCDGNFPAYLEFKDGEYMVVVDMQQDISSAANPVDSLWSSQETLRKLFEVVNCLRQRSGLEKISWEKWRESLATASAFNTIVVTPEENNQIIGAALCVRERNKLVIEHCIVDITYNASDPEYQDEVALEILKDIISIAAQNKIKTIILRGANKSPTVEFVAILVGFKLKGQDYFLEIEV